MPAVCETPLMAGCWLARGLHVLSKPENAPASLNAAPVTALAIRAGQWRFELTGWPRRTGCNVSCFNPRRTSGLLPVWITLTAIPGLPTARPGVIAGNGNSCRGTGDAAVQPAGSRRPAGMIQHVALSGGRQLPCDVNGGVESVKHPVKCDTQGCHRRKRISLEELNFLRRESRNQDSVPA